MNRNEIGIVASFVGTTIAVSVGGLASEKYMTLSGICAVIALAGICFFFYFLQKNSSRDFRGNEKKGKV